MPHAHHSAIESFWISAALILAALIYVRGWLRVGKSKVDAVQGWRVVSFLLGLFLIWAAIASPLAQLDHELLTFHMVQHLLLMTLAPPLIWLGEPMKISLQGLPQPFVRIPIIQVFRSEPAQRLSRVLANPAVCWLGAAGVLVGWHIPAVFMLGLQSQGWHEVEQTSFLFAGLLFWWPVVQPWPSTLKWPEWSMLLYLFLATLPCDILSGFLVFCDRVVYEAYFSSSQLLGMSPLEDQQCAGALMWTCVTVAYLIAGAIFTARLLSPQRSQEYSMTQSHSQLVEEPHATHQSMEGI